ncbi:chemotaxis protein methyltransferase CheR [Desulfocucumis palustris]|uniref:Chemotaxis protein methyltransferase CheR n=1 Tax=Desulfocucumis palustris TaxID=1898651 RepID=A0A2L2XHC2_9FIRM|nr:CheR family methyltransferase [Desulfocucumis palustris]GBF35103.1 chemotaxis protein methyltransferase CheR [Desulfocucumis palustris]
MAFTYFFRDLYTLELIIKHVVPHVAGRSKVRIWDAGCATGQEPYSLAIMFAENMGQFAFRNLRIDATDVDESNLFEKIISQGLYPEEDLKRIPGGLFRKYFRPSEKAGYFRIDSIVRSRVYYQRHNLLSLQPVGDGYSLVVCKNVLLHFQPEGRAEVLKMFHRALAPGGYLAMEQTQKLPRETAYLFEQVTDDAQLFRKVDVHSAGNTLKDSVGNDC